MVDAAVFREALSRRPVAKTAHFSLHALAIQVPTTGVGQTRASRPTPSSLGVVLPKRLARRAVTRNALRRRIYAVAARASQAVSAEKPQPATQWVVRLARGWGEDELRSARNPAWCAHVCQELAQLLIPNLGSAKS
jgi:ribonuclease P protein component